MNLDAQKVKEWGMALFVPLMFLAAWGSVSAVNAQNETTRLEIDCKLEKYHIAELKADRDQNRLLGLPVRYEIPERSVECIELDGP